MIGASVLAKHMSHDLEDRPDGTVRCLTCAHTLLVADRVKPTRAPVTGLPGCFDCTDGWKGEAPDGSVIACLSCRPHLKPMFERRQHIETARARALADREALNR